MGRFEGKVCIVAGGARGIGGKTARMYAEQGGRVLIGDVNEELGHRLAAEIGGSSAVFQPLDITRPEACQAAVERAVTEFGTVDHLVNSAIKMVPGPLLDLSLESWQRVVDIGLTGMFLMCQAFGRWVIGHDRQGAIVNLSSNAGVQPYGLSGAYSTVKAGIIMLTQHFGIEWAGKKIRANVVCPGHTETPLTAYLKDPAIKQARSEVTPLGRVGRPVDIAQAILFLLSDEADYITATRLDVDGGLLKSVFNHMPGRKWD
ncbi:MAG: SDR family NAD(P)-dependent oxidoreductase [Gammaproteobacteria bacterium]